MTGADIVSLDRLELRYTRQPWAFAEARRAEIDAHFAGLCRDNPHLWNGQVLLLRDYSLGQAVLRGAYLQTDFASFIAWRDWGFPDATIRNCFGQAALRSADGAFLLGIMGGHTANAGKMYFVGGTPDPHDVVGDTVDLSGSVARELTEETGLTLADAAPEPGWHAVFSGARIAMLKVLNAPEPAAVLRERVLEFLGREAHPELADVAIVRGPADLDGRMPDFVSAFLQHVWRVP
jgi:8-oxo-dGTP pyrophosphatase MutT (NUDIX family)